MNIDVLMNDFATRSFRDTADGDYIAARLAFRARLIPQFLWSSLQAIEKYLKCTLVLNRIRAPKSHNIAELLRRFEESRKFDLRLSDGTRTFLEYLDTYGRHRYFETSYYTRGREISRLDLSVWEVRRYARIMDYTIQVRGREIKMLPLELEKNELAEQRPWHLFAIPGGRLESIIGTPNHPSREPLLWQNAFFGRKPRKWITLPGRSESANPTLVLYPEILEEVLKYVYLPKDVVQSYRDVSQE